MKYFFIFFSFVYSLSCFAQQHDNTWLTGLGYGTTKSTLVDFNNTISIDTVFRNMTMSGAAVSMSDSSGNLIFYSNGIKVNNAQYQLMQNGDSLNPGQVANNNRTVGYPYTESMISIPHPNQANKYYIFHQGVTAASGIAGFGDKLYYTLVDMNANGGLGRVETKNQILLESDSMCVGQLEVVKHGNGRDWWLIQPMSLTNGYHVFLVKDNSITYHQEEFNKLCQN